jgi:ATP-binding cassette subfamily B protein
VAIARGMARGEADLLILDEPYNGLDPETEHLLQQRLKRERLGKTTLLISHRLSTIREADVIVVLDDGRVHDIGTHEELMAASGRYSELFRLQASGYREGVTGE